MAELDVISLEQAKNHLVVDLTDTYYDAQITGLIKTAIGLVEQYTCHYLWQRPKTYPIVGNKTCISDYPLQIIAVSDSEGNPVSSFNLQICNGVLDTCVNYYQCGNGGQIGALVGYSDVTDVPHPLIAAAYKLITYLFENKDAYMATLPHDVQLLLNQWRRSPTV